MGTPYLLSVVPFPLSPSISLAKKIMNQKPNNGQLSPDTRTPSQSLSMAKDLDHEKIVDLLDQYKHRILSLEADLGDQIQKGRWGAEHAKRRAQQLDSLKRGLLVLCDLNRELMENYLYKYDIGLPKLEGMGSLEHKICEDFLVSSQKDLKRFLTQVQEVGEWCLEAGVGGTHLVKSMLRLSKLGKMTRAVNLATGLVQSEHDRLDDHAQKALDAFQDPFVTRYLAKNDEKTMASKFRDGLKNQESSKIPQKKSGKNLIDSLAYWFNRMERQIAKIARARQELKNLDFKIHQMNSWLQTIPTSSDCPEGQGMPSILGIERDQEVFMPLLRLKRAHKTNQKTAFFLNSLGPRVDQG